MTFLRTINFTSQLSTRQLSFRKLRNWYANLSPKRSTEPPYSHITQIGDPILRRIADPIPKEYVTSEEVKSLNAHLRRLLKKYDCVGLSAPQIGVPLRIFVIEFNQEKRKEFSAEVFEKRKMSIIPFTIFINPEMKILNNAKVVYPEACESVKGFFADVPRYSEIEMKALNENGEEFTMKANGWTARIIQHEMDHLEGKLYTDSMDRKTLTCTCWQAVNERRGKIHLPFVPD